MCNEPVLRRLCKHIDTDFESVEAHSAWEDGSGMEFTTSVTATEPGEVVDVFNTEDIPADSEIVDIEAEIDQMEFPEGLK